MKKWRVPILAIMMLAMVALIGCQNEDKTGKTDVEGTTDETSSNATEDAEEIYADKVFDKESIKGKFSIFFVRSDHPYKGDSSTQHSGDSMILIAPDGTTMLIDMNTANNSSAIVSSLQKLGIDTIDYLVISHPHLDHYGGYALVFRYMNIKNIITNPDESPKNASYQNLLSLAEERNIPITRYREGDSFMFGKDVSVKVYNPMLDNNNFSTSGAQNQASLLMRFTYKDSSFMCGGDTYTAQERQLVEKYGDELVTDIVKMNHHGTETSNCREWVKAIQAKVAIGQMSNVESDIVMSRYFATGAVTLHTAMDGTVRVSTDGDGTYDVQTSRERWMTAFGTLDAEEGHLRIE